MHDKLYRKSCIPSCALAWIKLDDAQKTRPSKSQRSQIVSNHK